MGESAVVDVVIVVYVIVIDPVSVAVHVHVHVNSTVEVIANRYPMIHRPTFAGSDHVIGIVPVQES
jgi:hypothetical protein